MERQMSLFDGSQPFKIDKPIRLIELFAGYGSQSLALKYLGMNFEHHRIAEWAVKSIQAYKDMHFPDDNNDYSEDWSFFEIVEYLYNKGISANYNEPMTIEQIRRMGESKVRTVFNNIHATNNLVSVCNVKGVDLGITDTESYCYIMTYSFPCQDLSNAGKRKGMEKDSGTRSGLLWEVERILSECKELPQVLIMENVPEVIGQKNIKHFAKWVERLDELGYKSKWELINGTDFEMPQNRKRCFMVSVLGDYFYSFPQKKGCKLRLRDVIEKEVSEEYYLSNTMNGEMKDIQQKNICPTLDTRCDCLGVVVNSCDCVGMLSGGKWDNCIDSARRVYSAEQASPTLTTCAGGNQEVKIVEPKCIGGIGEKQWGKQHHQGDSCGINNYRIRKLTPKECFRLMGVKDEDFERVAKNQSKSSLYHLAGDSIITNCLMAIFREML